MNGDDRVGYDYASTVSIRPMVEDALRARPQGLGEALLLALCITGDRAPVAMCVAGNRPGTNGRSRRSLDRALRAMGAVYEPSTATWRLPATARLRGRMRSYEWSEELVVGRMLAFHAKHGRLPRQVEWKKAGDGNPGATTVRTVCGSWTHATRLATARLRAAEEGVAA